jgi:aminopeptidase-like protein
VTLENEMFDLLSELYPICRSITGNGVRKSLKIIQKYVDLEIHEVPTGTKVFDWVIPKEWNINDAYIIDPDGKKILDFQKSNLHVVQYSKPINTKLKLDELKSHIYSISKQPENIPYVTSYYKETWGFCMSYNQFQNLPSGEYEICIDSNLSEGNLTYGEFLHKGKTEDEILTSCYVCHPSMCNDNLSGVTLTTFLAKNMQSTNYSYRFLFIPETIGAITWLALNEEKISKIKHGLVATCVGDNGNLTYKKSRQGNAEIDHAACYVLQNSNEEHNITEFDPSLGSDERQFCSPGFNLPIGSLMRTPYLEFSEYHTSSDNLEFVKKEKLEDTYKKYISIYDILENNKKYVNLNPKCEPQLSKRGLYHDIHIILDLETKDKFLLESAILWILNLSDGKNSLLDIAIKSNIKFSIIKSAIDSLKNCGLVKEFNEIM